MCLETIRHTEGFVIVSDVFFKIKLLFFSDTVIPSIYFLIVKMNIFRGDLSDISAKTATLVNSDFVYRSK